jgi:hypothetical protein
MGSLHPVAEMGRGGTVIERQAITGKHWRASRIRSRSLGDVTIAPEAKRGGMNALMSKALSACAEGESGDHAAERLR